MVSVVCDSNIVISNQKWLVRTPTMRKGDAKYCFSTPEIVSSFLLAKTGQGEYIKTKELQMNETLLPVGPPGHDPGTP